MGPFWLARLADPVRWMILWAHENDCKKKKKYILKFFYCFKRSFLWNRVSEKRCFIKEKNELAYRLYSCHVLSLRPFRRLCIAEIRFSIKRYSSLFEQVLTTYHHRTTHYYDKYFHLCPIEPDSFSSSQ